MRGYARGNCDADRDAGSQGASRLFNKRVGSESPFLVTAGTAALGAHRPSCHDCRFSSEARVTCQPSGAGVVTRGRVRVGHRSSRSASCRCSGAGRAVRRGAVGERGQDSLRARHSARGTMVADTPGREPRPAAAELRQFAMAGSDLGWAASGVRPPYQWRGPYEPAWRSTHTPPRVAPARLGVASPLVAVRQADRGDDGGQAAIQLATRVQLLSGVRHPARSWAAAQAAHAGIHEVHELVARRATDRGGRRPRADCLHGLRSARPPSPAGCG